MDRTFLRIFLALAICLALTATVSANTIIANYTGQTQSAGVQYSLNSGASYTGTTAGIFTFNRLADPSGGTFGLDPLGPGASILAFCIQLEETISTAGNPITYEVVDLDKGRTPEAAELGDVRARQIDTLFTLAFGALGGINTPVSATVAQAVQVAIWEIAYETTDKLATTDANNLGGTTRFQGAGTNVLNTADGWLTTINGMSFDDTYQRKHFLWALNNVGRQDFVIQTPGSPADEQVPEPGTLALVGMALLGLSALRRKMLN